MAESPRDPGSGQADRLRRVTIRTAESSDARAIAALVPELTGSPVDPDQLTADLVAVAAQDNSLVLVAEAEGEVVRFLYIHLIRTLLRPGCWARLASMAVGPAHHRLGVGTALVRTAEEFAIAAGADSIELTSGNHRDGAHRFYESLGYEVTTGSRWYAKGLR